MAFINEENAVTFVQVAPETVVIAIWHGKLSFDLFHTKAQRHGEWPYLCAFVTLCEKKTLAASPCDANCSMSLNTENRHLQLPKQRQNFGGQDRQ